MTELLVLTSGKFEGCMPGDVERGDLECYYRTGNTLDRAIIAGYWRQQRYQRRAARSGNRFAAGLLEGIRARTHGRFS
jgi:hypothetical protein